MTSPRLLITTLAEYQTDFWHAVGLSLRRRGHEPAFLSFDDRSTERLLADNFRVFPGIDEETRKAPAAALTDIFDRFGVHDLNYWLTHERFAFGLSDDAAMRAKLAGALVAGERACQELASEGPVELVQELGGFLSVVGSYFAARSLGLHNWFIEPSFFRGRLFFLKNSFGAMAIPHDRNVVLPEVERYLSETIESQSIVIPLKDRHQYTSARKKIINWRNFRRLIEKVVDKHVYGKRQEFSHLRDHVGKHAMMLLNSRRLSKHYDTLPSAKPFVYYPLHVPGDMALTLRSPTYLDQLSLIDLLCRTIPATHRLAVKEHPAMVGAVSAGRLLELRRRYDNLRLLPPTTNNYEVLRQADLIVSVNSKSGAEAGLLGLPVMVLGDAFYADAPFAHPIDNIKDLGAKMRETLSGGISPPDDATRRFFSAVWKVSYPGELYVSNERNIEAFVDSMLTAIGVPA